VHLGLLAAVLQRSRGDGSLHRVELPATDHHRTLFGRLDRSPCLPESPNRLSAERDGLLEKREQPTALVLRSSIVNDKNLMKN
jgi:hypothetical protein